MEKMFESVSLSGEKILISNEMIKKAMLTTINDIEVFNNMTWEASDNRDAKDFHTIDFHTVCYMRIKERIETLKICISDIRD